MTGSSLPWRATRRASQEIRKFSLLFGRYSLDWDLGMTAHMRIADAGDVEVVPGDKVTSYDRSASRDGVVSLTRSWARELALPSW
jgi:arginase family enzyme